MAPSQLSDEVQRRLVAAWRETGRVLAAHRLAELAAQSPLQSQEAAFDMLQLGGMLPEDTARERDTGLIEMQRIFSRWHAREPA